MSDKSNQPGEKGCFKKVKGTIEERIAQEDCFVPRNDE